jgi:integrase
MASLRNRNGLWQVQIRRKSVGSISKSFQLKADALAWARKQELEYDQVGLPSQRNMLKSIFFSDLVDRYIEIVLPTKRNPSAELWVLRAFKRHPLAQCALSHLDAKRIADYRDERLQAISASGVRREFSTLRHVISVAMREWNLPLTTNPFQKVLLPRENPARERRLSLGEYERLVAAAQSARSNLMLPVMLVALETGMRLGELLSVCWADLNLERATLLIRRTKNGYPRTIPLTAKAVAIISDLSRQNPRLFPLSSSAVKQCWRRLTKRAGVLDLHFHDLRHEAISRFFEFGLTVPEVASISGHRDIRQLMRYAHANAGSLAAKLQAAPHV